MRSIQLKIGTQIFTAEIYDTPTTDAIYRALPIKSTAMIWGDEVYFQISANASLEEGASSEVAVGDLAYWLTMPAFCIFFGPTPASIGNEPKAVSAVNIFAKLRDVDINALKSIKSGDKVEVFIHDAPSS